MEFGLGSRSAGRTVDSNAFRRRSDTSGGRGHTAPQAPFAVATPAPASSTAAASDTYSSVTSNDFPLDTSDLSGTPRGTRFDENDIASLKRRFPRLAARFR
jgi:hypothetical protein